MPIKVSKDPLKNWENNAIQFPRLIAELEAQGVFDLPGVRKNLSEEMDILDEEINAIIDRAQVEWEGIKTRIFENS